MNNNMESTPPDLRTVEGDDQSTPEELLATHNTMTNQPKDVEDASKKIAIEVTATLDVVLFKGKYTPSVLVTIGKILQEKIEPILTTHTEKRVREAVEEERKRLKEKLQDYWVEAALSDQPKDL